VSFVLIECGSSARGDFNPESDRDIVCIWKESKPDFESLKKSFGDIAFYSEKTISKMKNKGSLFIAHLGVDGKHLLGDRTLLSIFKDFEPNTKATQKNIMETESFIKSIEWFPYTDRGALWLLDVLYVALRNYIFCKNSLDEIYIFGYEKALKAFGLAQIDIELMLKLRDGKYAYRKGTTLKNLTATRDIAELACKKILKSQVRFREGGSTKWDTLNKSSYWTERLIERAILNNEHADSEFIDILKSHQYNKQLLKSKTLKIVESHKKNQNNNITPPI